MAAISLLIKPTGSLCNTDCRYCFYKDEDRFKKTGAQLMSLDTLYCIFQKTLPFASGSVSVTFQGGEPTLAGIDFFKAALSYEKELLPDGVSCGNSFQTNGLLIDEKWAEFFAENNILVGISLDGTKELHDRFRVDREGHGTFDRVMRGIEILKKHGVEFNILSVLTHGSARKSEEIYRFFDQNGFFYRQFIPCLEPLESEAESDFSLQKGELAEFLKKQFGLWFADAIRGKKPYNRYFDNLLRIIVCGEAEACDMRGICGNILVCEANGDVYPCDFYCVDKYKLGNFTRDGLSDIEKRRTELAFVKISAFRDAGCSGCKWFFLCRGGCRRHRSRFLSEESAADRNRFCDDYKSFFEYAYPRLKKLAGIIKK